MNLESLIDSMARKLNPLRVRGSSKRAQRPGSRVKVYSYLGREERGRHGEGVLGVERGGLKELYCEGFEELSFVFEAVRSYSRVFAFIGLRYRPGFIIIQSIIDPCLAHCISFLLLL